MLRRYPVVRQADESSCGAAALATISLYYGIRLNPDRLRDLAGTDRHGSTLLGLADASERLGFSAKAVQASLEALPQVPLPAIAHVVRQGGQGHFVVLYRVSRGSVLVADPAEGLQKLPFEAFTKRWTGYLLLVLPDPASTRSQEGSTAAPLSRLVTLLRWHRSILAECLVCALCIAVLGLSTSYFIQHLVDSVLVRGETALLDALAAAMLLIVLFRTLFSLLRQYLLVHVGRKVDLYLVSSYARHLLRLPMPFFEMRRVGEILSRVHDAAKVRDIISGTVLTVLVDGVLVVALSIVLWLYDPSLAFVASLFAPLLVLSVVAHHRPVRQRSRAAMEAAAELSAHLVEDTSGVETIKAFGLERLRSEESESRLVRHVQSIFSLQTLGMSMSSTSMLVTGVAGIAILWYGGHRVVDGALTIGQLLFFYTLVSYVLGPLERLASVNLVLQDGLVAVDRLYQVMDREIEAPHRSNAVPFGGVSRAVELQGVSFRYAGRDDVLRDVTLRIPAKATVAIVGESGSGKSTLLKLLMRFHEASEGRILIDGIDIRDFELASLRSRIGFVSQEPFVFTGTIFHNIALKRPEVTLEAVVAAAQAVGLDEFIAALPQRYETMLGERGTNLSGGERQRLAIARALVRNPDILLFDEATSHLDSATERTIQDTLRNVARDKTVVLVAHRLSTVASADLVYVLHHGRVVEQGTHENLVAGSDYYSALWKAQTLGGRASGAGRVTHFPVEPAKHG